MNLRDLISLNYELLSSAMANTTYGVYALKFLILTVAVFDLPIDTFPN